MKAGCGGGVSGGGETKEMAHGMRHVETFREEEQEEMGGEGQVDEEAGTFVDPFFKFPILILIF